LNQNETENAKLAAMMERTVVRASAGGESCRARDTSTILDLEEASKT
jgi:hypothetical protein